MAATYVYLTSGSSWTVPDDWNDDNNTIECIGGGSHGAGWQNKNPGGSAGGGGAYAKKNNLALTPGATITYQIGQAGRGGTDTWFKSTSDVLAKGAQDATTFGGYLGGQASASVGDVKYSGGNGGSTYSFSRCGGGGGAAGPNGAGNNGGNATSGAAGTGGSGDAGYGGAGGAAASAGGNGTEWSTSPAYGSGGGGGGRTGTSWGGAGGTYGAGGGAQAETAATANVGVQGIIVITYTPAVTGSSNFFQLF